MIKVCFPLTFTYIEKDPRINKPFFHKQALPILGSVSIVLSILENCSYVPVPTATVQI